jgi:23S rRNA (cytidine1920-2'-O)/16S rRNA (cytidine1409-2'-O)-methyltransferase
MSRRRRLRALEQELRRIHPEVQNPRETILRGDVVVDGITRTNPASLVRSDAAITVRKPRSLRGRTKLASGLQMFDVDDCNRTALDIGAGTGGFTLALLEAGARRVYAVDAGHGQLLGSLRLDPRVVNLEATNLAVLGPQFVPETIDVVAFDLSYLGLRDAVPQLAGIHLADDADAIALVKPQFELRRSHLPMSRQDLDEAARVAAEGFTASGWHIAAIADSPVSGAGGAIELLLHARRGR